jgi:hypothetical protein
MEEVRKSRGCNSNPFKRWFLEGQNRSEEAGQGGESHGPRTAGGR